jgi:hypothetical protein
MVIAEPSVHKCLLDYDRTQSVTWETLKVKANSNSVAHSVACSFY